MKTIANLITCFIVFSCFCLLPTNSNAQDKDYQQFFNIRSALDTDLFIHIENGKPDATGIKRGWHSAMWTIIPANADYWTIQNRWKSNEYLSASPNGKVITQARDADVDATEWRVVEVPGTRKCMIYNRKFPHKRLNVYLGKFQLSEMHARSGTAHWTFDTPNPKAPSTIAKKETPAASASASLSPSTSNIGTYSVQVRGIKCVSVDSGEPGSSNEFYGSIEVGSSKQNQLPSVVWQRGENNPQEVMAGRSIKIKDRGMKFDFSSNSTSDYIYVKGTIKEEDSAFSGDDNLGTYTKTIAINSLRDGVNKFKVTGFRDDGDVAEIFFTITKKSSSAKSIGKASGNINSGTPQTNYDAPIKDMYFRYTDQITAGNGLYLEVGSKVYVLANQKVKPRPGLSFDPNNPKICGKIFTVKSLKPLTFHEPLPENMRDRDNNMFKLKVQKVK